MLEDYFERNTSLIPFERSNERRNLIDPFCIAEDGYLIFNLVVNYASSDTNESVFIRTEFFINGGQRVQSNITDDQEPSNVALFYEGFVTAG